MIFSPLAHSSQDRNEDKQQMNHIINIQTTNKQTDHIQTTNKQITYKQQTNRSHTNDIQTTGKQNTLDSWGREGGVVKLTVNTRDVYTQQMPCAAPFGVYVRVPMEQWFPVFYPLNYS